ncbi:MAG: FG-GAP-like repeat-containing protein [Candidatus Kapaibacterium sp.]
MKRSIFLLFAFFLSSSILPLTSQVLLQRDDGKIGGNHANLPAGSEETAILEPKGPCSVVDVQIYLSGTRSGKDTILIVGDPSEGAIVATSWVWHYNTLASFEIDYPGKPGWYTIDTKNSGVHPDGYDRIVVQHRTKAGGPYFSFDGSAETKPYGSYLLNPYENNSLGGPGNYYLASGDFLVRASVIYDYPSGNASVPPPFPTLLDVTKQAGITTTDGKPISADQVSVSDWNSDGYDDIAIGSKFFENQKNGTYKDVSSKVNITAGATAWGDIDNDGKPDCFALNGWGNDKIYRNNGDGTFTDITASTKIVNNYPGVTPLFLDYNHDGKIDLFIANGRKAETVNGQYIETYYPDQLWKNNGDGSFSNVTATCGIASAELAPYYDCWSASVCDYNTDGWPDIFVANYRLAPDKLFKNNKDGTFTDVGATSGAQGVPTLQAGYFGHGMGSDWGDFNNDGLPDLAVGNLGHPDWRGSVSNPSLVFKNNGAPTFTFTEMHQEMGVKFFEMNAGILWLDVDLDGYLDLWHSQYAYEAAGSGGAPSRYSRIYVNQGNQDGNRMEDATWQLGSLIHGAWSAARLDFDGDGDEDLIVASPTENLKLFRNDIARKGNWVTFRLTGNPAKGVSMDAFGSSVTVYAGAEKFFRQLSGSTVGARCSQSSNELHFGVGQATKLDSVVVKFPDGSAQKYVGLQANRKYAITYASANAVAMGVATPGLQAPINKATKQVPATLLKWYPTDGATGYKVEVSATADFSVPVFSADSLPTPQVTAKNLLDARNYFWRVRAIIGGTNPVYSPWSSVWSLTVGLAAPNSPKLISPAKDSLNVSITQPLKWNAVDYPDGNSYSTRYAVQVSEDATFTTQLIDTAGVSATSFTATKLSPDTKYYWRVAGMNEDKFGAWSETWNFTTLALPLVTTLVSPANGATGVVVKPSLNWRKAPNAGTYELQVDTSSSFTAPVISKSVFDSVSKIFSGLKTGRTYFWHVRAVNDVGAGPWSEVWKFTVEGIIGVQEHPQTTSEIDIEFSNPVQNQAAITVTNSSNTHTTVSILDQTGRVIQTLLDQALPSGEAVIEWNTRSVASGVYFVEVQSGDRRVTKKIMVTK